MRRQLFLIIALLCAVAQGAWAADYNVGTESDLKEKVQFDNANITLTANITLSERLVIGSGKTVTIDLNGHKLDRGTPSTDWYNMVIYVKGNLTINDGSGTNSGQITGGRSYNGAGVLCEEGSTLTVNGGTFTNNQASYYSESYPHGRGGAIFMNPNTTLTITGGVFHSNTAYNGGAIYVEGTATISGASFTNNTASYCGGAIYNSGTLTFNGDNVSGSSAPYGGAVYNTGTFNMTDGTIHNSESTKGGGGGLVNIGTVNMSGGTIRENTANTDGGGIWNGNSGDAQGTLNITGGSITYNTASRYGGGIWNENTVTISNGTINNNTGDDGGGIYNKEDGNLTVNSGTTFTSNNSLNHSGGAINNHGTLTVNGGSFTGNTAKNYGGAIGNFDSGTLTITGGTIQNNTASTYYGGGVYIGSGTFNMSGNPVITNNTVNSKANNLYLYDTNLITCSGAFTEGAKIGVSLFISDRTFTSGYGSKNGETEPSTYFTSDDSRGSVTFDNSEAKMVMTYTEVSSETALKNAITNGAYIKLTQDIVLSSYVNISDGNSVTIDLNGHKLDRNLSQRIDLGNVIRVQTSSALTIKDSKGDNSGQIKGGYDSHGGAICNYGTLIFEGGTITGCTGSSYGGAVYVVSGGSFTMSGGIIKSCSGNEGGAIYNLGTVTMSGGSIDGCSASDCGGIYNAEGGNLSISGGEIKNCTSKAGGGGVVNRGTATISGSTISGNHATSRGGGVWNGSDATLTITGGTIQNNTADTNGGGMFTYSTFKMSGNPKITDNTVGGSANNLYLNGDGTVIKCGKFSSQTVKAGVTLSKYNRYFTSGYYSNGNGGTANRHFSADLNGARLEWGGGYDIMLNTNEEVKYVYHYWKGSDTSGSRVSCNNVSRYDYQKLNGANEIGDGWYYADESYTWNDNRITVSGDAHLIIGDDVTLTCNKGIYIKKGCTLTLYGQEHATGNLKCEGSGGANAAIGGNEDVCGGNLVIHELSVYAKPSSNNAAGIGGGEGHSSGMESVTIYAGSVKAYGSSSGAGIGGGEHNDNPPSVSIYGGTVTAKGGDYAAGIGGGEDCGNGVVKIYKGYVTATGGAGLSLLDYKGGAGIGGGEEGHQTNPIYIYRGEVTAKGGSNGGAGIGGGGNGSGGQVYIYGGTVNATGGDNGAGIGGGKNKGGGTVEISGGTTTAKGGYYAAGIGGGYKGSGGTVNITDGQVTATGGTNGAGIGGGEEGSGGTFSITSGNSVEFDATGGSCGAGIGGGKNGNGGNVTIAGGVMCIEGKDNAYAVGRGDGGSSDGSLVLDDSRCVMTSDQNQSRVTTSERESTLRTAGKRRVKKCPDHAEQKVSDKDEYYHHWSCKYCGGEDEQHKKYSSGSSCYRCGRQLSERTYTFYEANTDGTGYATTGTEYYPVELKTFTFPSCSEVPGNMIFAGWEETNTAPSSLIVESTDGLKKAGDKITVEYLSNDRTYYARYQYYELEGSGTEDNPYKISTTDELNRVAYAVNHGVDLDGQYLFLANDLEYDGSENNYTPVGNATKSFCGNFDGQGHSISGINISGSNTYQALFGMVGTTGTVKNLTLRSSTFKANSTVGGIVGENNGTIENCHVADDVTIEYKSGNSGDFGGIVGNNYGTVEGCTSAATVDGKEIGLCVGGIAGFNYGTLKNCLYLGNSLTGGDHVGAIAGWKHNDATLTSNYYVPWTDGPAAVVKMGSSASEDVSGATAGYTVTSGIDGLTLDYGEATKTYDYDGIKVNNFGLTYQYKFYTGGTQVVTFNAVTDVDKVATGVTASKGTLTGNAQNGYTLTMASANSIVTATISDRVDTALELFDAPGTNDPTNTSTIDNNKGQFCNVTISGRTLYKDGKWNTICLPFDVSAENISANTYLQGAIIMGLDTEGWYDGNTRYTIDGENYVKDGDTSVTVPVESSPGFRQTGFDNGTLYLYFQTVTEIEGRRPYLIRWEKPTGYDDAPSSFDFEPTFYGSYIKNGDLQTVNSADGCVSFNGNYDPEEISGNSYLYLGSGNKLYWPSTTRQIKSFRGYFKLNGIEADNPVTGVRAFVLNFGDDGETTGIVGVEHGILNIEHSVAAGWYDLSGRKLSGKPTQKGVYIYNGNKRIIK